MSTVHGRRLLVAIMLVAGLSGVALIVAAGNAGAGATCYGREIDLAGDGDSETLLGTKGSDVISGGGGDDRMFGAPGNDFCNGQDGNGDYAAPSCEAVRGVP